MRESSKWSPARLSSCTQSKRATEKTINPPKDLWISRQYIYKQCAHEEGHRSLLPCPHGSQREGAYWSLMWSLLLIALEISSQMTVWRPETIYCWWLDGDYLQMMVMLMWCRIVIVFNSCSQAAIGCQEYWDISLFDLQSVWTARMSERTSLNARFILCHCDSCGWFIVLGESP